jgi:uroporphyrin-3 C-methyltransferase
MTLMSESVDPIPAAASPASAERAVPSDARWFRHWVLVAALLLLAVGGAVAWIDARNAQRELRLDFAKKLGEIEAGEQVWRTALKAEQENMREAQAKVALLESRVAESQTQQAALEALYRELAPSRDEWALTEIEQMLILASQQLQFAGNVASALAALQLADSKLQRLERPQFLPLRRAVGYDMDRLKAVPFVDVAGVSLRLEQAIAAVDSLPLALEERLPAPPAAAGAKDEPAWRRYWREIWQELRQLVRVENLDRPEAPLLAPSQQYFLRENLRLRLLSARIALLLRDASAFRADLTAADAWLRRYFDVRAEPVQKVLALVKQAQATDMANELPDLARSLEAVRVLKLAREKPQR